MAGEIPRYTPGGCNAPFGAAADRRRARRRQFDEWYNDAPHMGSPQQYARKRRRKRHEAWAGDLESDILLDRWRTPPGSTKYTECVHNAARAAPRTRDGLRFRNRFRLSYEVFDALFQKAKRKWPEKPRGLGHGRGPHHAPLLHKVLACLRILGLGLCTDTASWESNVSAPVLNKFLHKFVAWVGEDLYADEVAVPTGEKLAAALHVYEKLGLPGCLGSVDGVHTAWDACPSETRWQHVGKEGYPTLAYNVTVLHTREIIHVAGSCPGRTNDLTQARYDALLCKLRGGKVGEGVKYSLYQSDGSRKEREGLWVVCDNGYHKWRCLMPPIKHASRCTWSRQVESVRKDVECTFGVLKKRFRILRLATLYKSKEVIDNIFRSCCVLHNLLLRADGLSTIGRKPTDWRTLNTLQVQAEMMRRGAKMRAPFGAVAYGLDDATETESDFDSFRQSLIVHFQQHVKNHGMSWPKTAARCRGLGGTPIPQPYMDDVEGEMGGEGGGTVGTEARGEERKKKVGGSGVERKKRRMILCLMTGTGQTRRRALERKSSGWGSKVRVELHVVLSSMQ